ncbi:MAG: LPS export ABC transporter permease LptG [Desulfatibacillaceae bacterium]
MTILQKYATGSVLRIFAASLAAVLAIYLAVDFFERIDDFMENRAPMSMALEYFALRIPFVIDQVAPVAVLLAVLLTFGLMAKNNELMAFRAAGGSSYHLLAPVLAFGVIASGFLFFWGEMVVPVAASRANAIWNHGVKNETAYSLRERDIWIRQPGLIARFQSLPAGETRALGVSLNYFDEEFTLVKKYDALRGVYGEGGWRLEEVVVQTLGDEGFYEVEHLDSVHVELDVAPDDMRRVQRDSEEMGYFELADYVRRMREEGYDVTRYVVDLADKTAFPLVCLVMATLGGAMGLRGRQGEGLAVNVVLGVFLAFGYWVVHSTSVSLGYADILPPVLAAWAANAVFAAAGVVLVVRLD